MPITIKTVDLEYIILPIELLVDGSCQVTVRKGYKDNGIFNVIEGNTVTVPVVDTSAILDADPVLGLSRRNDLALAIYQYLVANNHVEPGVIS
jgi:hypothetical protein